MHLFRGHVYLKAWVFKVPEYAHMYLLRDFFKAEMNQKWMELNFPRSKIKPP